MVIQEVKMSAGKAIDLGQRLVDPLGVERPATREERVLVAERAMVGAATRDHQGVRDEVSMPLNEIPPYRRQPGQRPDGRFVAGSWRSCGEVAQELGEGVLARTAYRRCV